MNCIKTFCTPLKPNEVVERSLNLKLQSNQARYCLKWGVINSVVFALLLTDIKEQCSQISSFWYYVEYLGIVMTGLSTVACLLKYIMYVYRSQPMEGTEDQKHLLQFEDNDVSFLVSSPKKKKESRSEDTSQEAPINPTILSWHSSFNDSRGFGSNWSFNCASSPQQKYSPQSQKLQPQYASTSQNASALSNSALNGSNVSDNNIPFVSPYHRSVQEPITDEISLQKYLQDVSRKENSITDLPDVSQTFNNGSMNSFWNYCNSAAHILKTSLYQLAPLPVVTSQTNFKENGGLCIVDSNSEVIRRISSEKLSRYVGNLRTWLSSTILQRLSREIFNIDESFKHRGFHDMRIGGIGLDRLKKTIENQQFTNQYMPMLPLIVPFLEMSSNQEYLVKRIKDLAQGSCITDYCWNSGSEYHGLKWDEHLPTDSAILFHLLCVYLDTQLMPLPQGGGRPFYSRYVVIGDEKRSSNDTVAMVKNRVKCAILCTNPMKPKFNFISDGEIHNCAYDRNNLFYVIIQFLIYMRTRQESCLEGVNLGKSGINIMCVIEE